MPSNYEDKYNLVYLAMVALGAGVLFPYNAFISAPDYFQNFPIYAAKGVDSSADFKYASIWKNIGTWFVLVYSLPNTVVQLVIALGYGQKMSMYSRMVASICTIIVSMLVVPLLSVIKGTEEVALAVLFLAVAICGMSSAGFQCTVFGLGGIFPSQYTQAVMMGQGWAGLSVCTLRIVTKAAGSASSGSTDSTVYFSLATAWMIVCIVVVVFVRRNAFSRHFVEEFRPEGYVVNEDEGEDEDRAFLKSPGGITNEQENSAAEASPILSSGSKSASPSARQTYSILWRQSLAVFNIFLVTLTVFPGLVTQPKSTLMSQDWFAVVIITLFNVGDTIGRTICRFQAVHISMPLVYILTAVRYGFIVFYIIAVTPAPFRSDYVEIVMMLVMGTTNGWLGSLCMMSGSSDVRLQKNQREMAGNLMSFSLLLGICGGSGAAIILGTFFVKSS
eukprot:PhM_4_TR708/c0_g2_i1/m.52248